MKIAAFDIGDRWTGIATCDPLEIVASPYKTVATSDLTQMIKDLNSQNISHFVVGLPTTMRGTDSQQTLKVRSQFEELKTQFPESTWVLFDERLTSKQADKIKHAKTKEDKLASHSIAAAIILSVYLEYRKIHENTL